MFFEKRKRKKKIKKEKNIEKILKKNRVEINDEYVEGTSV